MTAASSKSSSGCCSILWKKWGWLLTKLVYNFSFVDFCIFWYYSSYNLLSFRLPIRTFYIVISAKWWWWWWKYWWSQFVVLSKVARSVRWASWTGREMSTITSVLFSRHPFWYALRFYFLKNNVSKLSHSFTAHSANSDNWKDVLEIGRTSHDFLFHIFCSNASFACVSV